MNTKNVGMYIHIPFCKHKCKYCDFKSYAGKENKIKEYIKWLKYEIAEVGIGNRMDFENGQDKLAIIDTIYIGGGTPSLIESSYIKEILQTVRANFTVKDDAEITIEINPGTVDENKLKDYMESGINRLSIGLQSTNNDLLKSIGRIHTYSEFEEVIQGARKIGFNNINADLMIGLPNQTLQDVKESLKKLISYNLEHISVYSLIVEEGTTMFEDVENKKVMLPPDELEREMYWTVKKILEQNGYKHYEISNFAKPGLESKHNMHCWEQNEYIGMGVAAHSYTNDTRYSNIDTIEGYIENYKNGKQVENFVFHEKQDKSSKMNEYMILGLRQIDGVEIQKFKAKFGENPIYVYHKELEKLVSEDLLEIDGDIIKLTNRGLDLANLVWEEFV